MCLCLSLSLSFSLYVLFLLVAGALLLTPGLITDAVALALLVPPVRHAVARTAVRWLLRRAGLTVEVHGSGGPSGGRQPPGGGDGPVIEGEFERMDDAPPRPRRDGEPTARP